MWVIWQTFSTKTHPLLKPHTRKKKKRKKKVCWPLHMRRPALTFTVLLAWVDWSHLAMHVSPCSLTAPIDAPPGGEGSLFPILRLHWHAFTDPLSPFFLYVIIRQAMPFCVSAKWRLFYEWLWSLSGDVGSWGQFCHSSVSNIFQFNSPTKNQVRNWGHVYRIWLETHWDPGEEAAGNRKWRQNKGNTNYVAGPCSESQGTSIKTRHLLVKDRG